MTQQIITVAALVLAAGCVAWQLRDFIRICRMERAEKRRSVTLLKIRVCNLETEVHILRKEVERMKREFALDENIYVTGKENNNG